MAYMEEKERKKGNANKRMANSDNEECSRSVADKAAKRGKQAGDEADACSRKWCSGWTLIYYKSIGRKPTRVKKQNNGNSSGNEIRLHIGYRVPYFTTISQNLANRLSSEGIHEIKLVRPEGGERCMKMLIKDYLPVMPWAGGNRIRELSGQREKWKGSKNSGRSLHAGKEINPMET